ADRFSAFPNNKDYGAITVAINLRGKAETVLKVPREKFTPPPNVDSAVVRIDIEKDKFAGADLKAVRNVVRAAFSSRRKMLANNLINGLKLTRAEAETTLLKAGISLTARGETLSAEEYVRLTEVLNGVKNG
ncbi:MAG: 16S rRNA (adenine(1518)-N(6)/adenine(1519)-N(6))-dimethyltransferase, partial [Clostridia bacterium]|nr:16S rRNA (adenine(1518)-N(6)/adenine(1519)-N(6))-dimethyltransferase [Clostridia bacterium]